MLSDLRVNLMLDRFVAHSIHFAKHRKKQSVSKPIPQPRGHLDEYHGSLTMSEVGDIPDNRFKLERAVWRHQESLATLLSISN